MHHQQNIACAAFICSHCKCVCQRNPRLKKQSYCSSPACQNARKCLHEKAVNATAKGKAAKKQRNESWRKNHNAHAYQACYRATHPEYVENNRLQQRQRNLDRAQKSISKIVKTDTLMLVMQPRRQLLEKTGQCWLFQTFKSLTEPTTR